MFYAYLARCSDGSLYAGYAKDVHARIACHNEGSGARYTRSRRPVTLAYFEEFPDKSSAMKREYQLKRLTKAEKEALASLM